MKILLLLSLFLGNAFAMNKGELIDAMAKDAGIEKEQIKRGVHALESHIAKKMKKGESVSIVGFGTFVPNANEKKKLLKTKVKFSPRFVKPHTSRYTDNFFKTMTDIMASSTNHTQYVCDNKDNDCNRTDGGTKAQDYNSSRSNTTAVIMLEMAEAISLCYNGEVSLYEEVYSSKLVERAKARCSEGVSKAIANFIRKRPGRIKESANLTNIAQTGIDSFFDIFTEWRDTDSDDDGLTDDDELIEAVAKGGGLSKADAKRALDGFVSAVSNSLKKGDRVSLVGFGSFSISKRAARTGRNPHTGKEIKIAAKNVVRFKAGSELSGKVN